MTPRPQLLAASVLLIAALAVPARGQYVEDSIDVGGAWVGSLTFNSRMNVIYGASEDGILFTISCDSNRLIHSAPLSGAYEVVYSSLDNKAYCVAGGGDGTVAVIDGTTHEVVRSIPMAGSTNLIWDSVGNRVYVANDWAGNVGVIDCRTDSVIAMIPCPGDPWQLDMNASGRKLYVRNYDAGSVTIINMDLNTVIRTLPVGDYPTAGCYCPSQNKYYCVPLGEAVVVDGTSDSIIRRVRLPGTPPGLCYDMIWVPSSDLMMTGAHIGGSADSIAVLDPSTDSLVAIAAVQRVPYCLLLSPVTSHVLCANGSSRSVSVISADGRQVVATVPVGWAPFAMEACPRNGRVYVGHLNTDWVYVIHDTSAAVSEEPMTQTKAASMTASPNPFGASIEFSGSTNDEFPCELSVFSRTGERVVTLHPARAGAGEWRCTWDGRDGLGRPTPAGVYFVRSAGYAARSIVKTGRRGTLPIFLSDVEPRAPGWSS